MKRQNVMLLVGAGAEEHAWCPIIRALRGTAYPNVRTDDEANAALSNIVHQLRLWIYANGYLETRGGKTHAPSVEAIAMYRRAHAEICAAIRVELQRAERDGELTLRPEFARVWKRFVLPHKFTVLTTNWDRTITTWLRARHRQADEKTVHHLHGDRRSKQPLLLPAEVSFEAHRTEAEHKHLLRKHLGLMRVLEKIDRVVIYGLSLSPLDEDLSTFLTTGVDTGAVSEIIVIDPDHHRIVRRLMARLHHRKPRMFGVEPNDLENTTTYEWPVTEHRKAPRAP